MFSLNYITGKEAVAIFDQEDFEDFIRYTADENPDCIQQREFTDEKEMQQFVAGLEAGGYKNYSIVDETEARQIKEAIGINKNIQPNTVK